jgi:hypothetical protein
MVRVAIMKPVGHEHLHPLAQQFLARVSEEPFSLGIDEHDLAVAPGVDDHHRVRSGFEQSPEPGFDGRVRQLGGMPRGDVGHQHREAAYFPVLDVRDVGRLRMAWLTGQVDDRPIKQLRLAGEGTLDVRSVQGVELRPEHLADMPTADLFGPEPEELHVRAVRDPVAQRGVPIAHHRRQGIQDRSEILPRADPLPRGTVADLLAVGGDIVLTRRVWHVAPVVEMASCRVNLPDEKYTLSLRGVVCGGRAHHNAGHALRRSATDGRGRAGQ